MSAKVLFVDDQEEILELIKIKLAGELYEKFYAENATEAMKIVESEGIDVVVTDIFMPDIGGLDLLKRLKESHPDVVRVVLSGFSQVNTVLEAINSGDIFRFITKPWRVDEEGKMIIKDAIEYAELLKKREEAVPLETVKEILSGVNLKYEISDKVSDGMKNYKIGNGRYIVIRG